MAKNEGYIRVFVDFGMSLTRLLRQVISRGIESLYASKLLDIIVAEENQRKIKKAELFTLPVTPGILSEREFEVMRLVAEGLPNQEIANRLFITLNTTKTHVRHIFDKLGVNDRPSAIAKARELKLI